MGKGTNRPHALDDALANGLGIVMPRSNTLLAGNYVKARALASHHPFRASSSPSRNLLFSPFG